MQGPKRRESDAPEPPRWEPGERSGGPGPIVLVLPICALILGILWLRHWRSLPRGERAQPPAAQSESEVQGWAGSRVSPEGVHFAARLTPLHPDRVRQDFDRQALIRRLDLDGGDGDGEGDGGSGRQSGPWRLVLAARRAASGEGALPEHDLAELRVVDDAGVVQRPIQRPGPPPKGAVADPLVALLAPPQRPLECGQEVTFVLWGPRPGRGVHLEGLGAPLPLNEQRVPLSDLVRSLARLDRAQEGD